MSILSDFEDRVGGALEGAFASVFRSPVQPAEIAKALARAMDDGRVTGVGKVYAPVSYVVAISIEDSDNFGAFITTLAGELSTFLVDHAREHVYHLTQTPRVDFVEDDALRLGRFRVTAELAFEEEEPFEPGPAPGAVYDHESERAGEPAPAFAGPGGLSTVTVGETGHDVALRGDRVLIGRTNACDICLPDANVSRSHAAIVCHDGAWHIEDLDSTNGTLLNGHPVASGLLRDGDVIEIGLTRLTYHSHGR
jgi:hypothetical protein